MAKKGLLRKFVELISSKPKQSSRLKRIEANFVNSFFDDSLDDVIIKDQLGKSEFPTLDDGDINIDIKSTLHSRELMGKVYQKYHTQKIQLTLTPICEYQIKQKWPEPPFVNVNLFGSQQTEQTNWLGYIEINSPNCVDLQGIVEDKGNVNVWASIHAHDGEYFTRLHLSEKYKYNEDEFIDTYISHDKTQITEITTIAQNTGYDFLQVDMEKLPGQNYYIFLFNGLPIGSATVKKIDSCLKGKKLHKAFVKITKFRFNDESDNKHYSSLTIIPK